MSTKFGLLIDFVLLKAVTSTNTKPDVVLSGRGRHLEKWIWRHISAVGAPLWTKFGSLMQNNMQITKKMVEIETGSRITIRRTFVFFKNGSSYVSAVNWDMSTRFGLLIGFDLLKTVTSRNTKPDVVSSGRGRHLTSYFRSKWFDLYNIR